jgi:hypothetical protein
MSLRQHIPTTRPPNTVATTIPTTPTLLGIAGELRNHIFELIAATTEKRVILGRKLVQIIDDEHDGTIHGQVPSAAALAQAMALRKQDAHRFLIGDRELPVVHNFLVILKYRDL